MNEHERLVFEATGLRAGRMLQLGSKPRQAFMDPFTAMGFEVVGVDLDGKEGCVSLDLCEPGVLKQFGKFDIITNYGTTEHCGDIVEEQVDVWRNLHDALKVGGWFVSTTPNIHRWRRHGIWLPGTNWFNGFSATNGYSVAVNSLSSNGEAMVLYAGRKDQDHPFKWPDEVMDVDTTGGSKLHKEELAKRFKR